MVVDMIEQQGTLKDIFQKKSSEFKDVRKRSYNESVKHSIRYNTMRRQSPLYLLGTIILSIFLAEVTIMFFFTQLPHPPVLVEAFLDAFALIMLLSPILYFFLFRPLSMYIKEHERLNKELEESLEDLKEIDRMRNEFVDVASHELRTPLSSIKVYSDLMRSGKIGSFTEKEFLYLNDIESNLFDLNKLINEMLDHSRVEAKMISFSPDYVDMTDLVVEIMERFKTLAETCNISISLMSCGETEARFDVELMKKVLINLIGNAVKYSEEKGQIILNVENQGNSVGITIKDSGIGICKEHLPYVFERFYMGDTSLTRDRDRLGFGLPIAKAIVERHGGNIWVESEEGKGSTFSFTIPKRVKEEDKTMGRER